MPIKIIQSQVLTVSGSSAKFTNPMATGQQYRFTATTDCWVKVGATGDSAAAATAGNHFVAKGQWLPLSGDKAAEQYVHAIQASAGGYATLSLIEGI